MAPTIPIEFTGQKEAKKRLFSQNMGKAGKYSRAPSGFVPDYRHDVETMAESKGFGSCGRVEPEIALDDSVVPGTNCMRLNADSYDGFDIPKEMLPVSKMSWSERINMLSRLKVELEHVRDLHKKVSSFTSAVLTLSPSSDVQSYADGQMKANLESFDGSLGISGSQGLKKGISGRNGFVKRKNASSRPKLREAFAAGTFNASMMKQCEALLSCLMSHQHSWVFNEPVDVGKLNIPDYFTVIKHPMDLGTVKKQLAAGKYSSPFEFTADVRLTFSNAMTYNPPGNDVHIMAQTLSKLFENRWKTIEKKASVTDPETMLSKESALMGSEITAGESPAKQMKVASTESKIKPEPPRRVMSDEDKKKLSAELEALLDALPGNIVEFLREHTLSEGQTGEDEIEIDIYTFSDEILFKLRKLLDDHLLEKQQTQAKAEPGDMQIVNDSGFSSSPLQRGKGEEPVDEEVDIVGGYEAPCLGHPPDTVSNAANGSSKGGTSSCSTGDLGSSTSGSDSGISSGYDSDSQNQGNMESGTKMGRTGDGQAQEALSKTTEEKHDVGQISTDKQSTDEANGIQEGEGAPCGRQISPDKRYRAALLKNRFADTILKAREKALDKCEKGDPEKLRMERELEKQRREEKARLQAEAYAAEEAQRIAGAQAAAEGKRKREQEREAARKALQQMEQTVDINENSQFLEDIEQLRAATQGKRLSTFAEEASPDHSENILGSFKSQGSSNPLEQLGLYMKMDDEDDHEEDEPPKIAPEQESEERDDPTQSRPKQVKDVDDGEIG